MDKKYKRAWILGDLHFGIHSNSLEWLKNQLSFFINYFIPILKKHAKPGDVIIFTGDVHDHNSMMRIEIMNRIIDLFIDMSKICDIKIICGNHDIVKKYTNDINSIKPLGLIPGVTVYTTPGEILLDNGEKILMLPWCHSPKDELKIIKETDCEYAVSHTHLIGMMAHDEFIFKTKDGNYLSNKLEDFKKFKRVWNGHIHKYEEFGTVMNVGVPSQTQEDYYKYDCGFVLMDFNTGEEKVIKNKYSPTFKKINFHSIVEMPLKEALAFVKNAYVKIYYPTSLSKTIRVETILDVLEGYRDVEFKPLTERTGSKITSKDWNAEEQVTIQGGLDVKSKLPEYIESLDISDDIKKELSADLDLLFQKAEGKYVEHEEE